MGESAAHISTDALNRFGLWILTYGLEPRYSTVCILGITAAFACVHRRRYGRWPDNNEWIRGVLAFTGALGALLSAAIFLLTKPPAYNLLSDEMRSIIGLMCLVTPTAFAIREVNQVFLKGTPVTRKDQKLLHPAKENKNEEAKSQAASQI